MSFQQKWIFLNKVLHEMEIEFPTAELNARFKVMDDQYRTLMRISVADPMVLSLIVPNTKRSPYFQGASSQLQVHGHQAVCPGVAEVTSLIRILRALLDPHLHLFEEEKPHTKEDFSGTDLVTQNFRSSKSKAQSDCISVYKKERRHLLAISSFLFAIIWGFGAHLSSRYYDNGRCGVESAEAD